MAKSQQNRIGLVAKPVTPLLQPGYESCGSGVPERPFAEGRDPGLAFRQHVRLQAVQDLLHHQTQSSYPAKLSQEPHFTPSFLQEPQEKVSHKRVLPMTPWFLWRFKYFQTTNYSYRAFVWLSLYFFD